MLLSTESFSQSSAWEKDTHLTEAQLELTGKSESVSGIQLFGAPWTVAHEAPLSLELSRQEYWSGLPHPSPGDIPDPGIKSRSPALQADSLPSEPPRKPWLWEEGEQLWPLVK